MAFESPRQQTIDEAKISRENQWQKRKGIETLTVIISDIP